MVRCGHDGCTERATFRYQTRRDMVESFEVKHYSDGRWRCVRHARPSEVLGVDNPETRFELVAEDRPSGRYFNGQGFVHGPGFKAFAQDFPVGTKIIVSARLVLPSPPPTDEEE